MKRQGERGRGKDKGETFIFISNTGAPDGVANTRGKGSLPTV